MTSQETITVQVSLMSTLKRFAPPDGIVTINKDANVEDLITHLGVDSQLVQMVFIDGSFCDRKHPLAGANKVLLLPTVGGG